MSSGSISESPKLGGFLLLHFKIKSSFICSHKFMQLFAFEVLRREVLHGGFSWTMKRKMGKLWFLLMVRRCGLVRFKHQFCWTLSWTCHSVQGVRLKSGLNDVPRDHVKPISLMTIVRDSGMFGLVCRLEQDREVVQLRDSKKYWGQKLLGFSQGSAISSFVEPKFRIELS